MAILRALKDSIPNAETATLDELIGFAEKLSEVSTTTIDNALALTASEKTQLRQDIGKLY